MKKQWIGGFEFKTENRYMNSPTFRHGICEKHSLLNRQF